MKKENQGYVYSKQSVTLEELKQLLEELGSQERGNQKTYYFLRTPHKVSGICMKLPEEFPTAEGQMFNANCELRWKKRKSGYDVLVLFTKPELDLPTDKVNAVIATVGSNPKPLETHDECVSPTNFFKQKGFQEVSGNWETSDFDAYFYNNKPESRTKFPTKFPKGFTFKGLENEEIEPTKVHIGQRYFKDKDTAIVHFIALTVLG